MILGGMESQNYACDSCRGKGVVTGQGEALSAPTGRKKIVVLTLEDCNNTTSSQNPVETLGEGLAVDML